ncbi:MAG: acyltransferase [bacterium]|nr:acyltransferase [bacterium]
MEDLVQKRSNYADIAKAIAIFLVIVGHVRPDTHDIVAYKSLIYAFHMPLFFIISGMFVYAKREVYSFETWKNFLKKNFLILIIPFIIWGLIYMNFSYENFFIFLFGSRQAFLQVGTLTSLWFLPVLFLARILLEGLFHITDKLKWNLNLTTFIFMFIFWAIGIFLPHHNSETEFGNFWCYDVAFVAAGFMLMGKIIKPLTDKLSEFKLLPLLGLFILFSAAFCYGFSLTKFSEEFVLMCEGRYYLFFILNALNGSFAALVFSVLANRFIGENKFVKYVGMNTMGIYLLHKNMLPDIINFISQFGFTFGFQSYPIMSSIIALFLSCIGVFVIKKTVPEIIGAKRS